MRLKTFLGWTSSVILCLIYSITLSAYGFLQWRWPETPSLFPVASAAPLFLSLVAFCLLITRCCRKRGLDISGYWRGALLVLMCLPIVWIMTDAKPIECDYCIADVVSNDPEVLKSYDTLMLLRKDGGIKVDETISASNSCRILTQDCTNALAYSNEIYRAWDNIADARAIIEKLDFYSGIADLTSDEQLGTNISVVGFRTMRRIGHAYAAYARLKTAEGQPEEAARQLATLHRVTRKALSHAAILVDKMIWVAIGNLTIESAAAMLRDPHCMPQTVEILRAAFPSLAKEEVDLRRVFISEYLWVKAVFGNARPSNFIDFFVFEEVGTPQKPPSSFRKWGSGFVYYLSFRKNRTFRDFRACFDPCIEGADICPPDTVSAETAMLYYSAHPDIRNLAGRLLVAMGVPSFGKACASVFKTKVLSDLLAIEIGDCLNQPVILDDCYAGAPYGRNKVTGRAFSVGPDQKPNTADDIVLGADCSCRGQSKN